MYLKQIEMQGFKSFPDRTRLVFEPGATVIIGPNGSGKSNISDAMRWVLGEISSKSLRGAKMEDIIFGGSDSRKPMGYAEVSVTFDNTATVGRLDCPYDEVTVTRRYYRNGDSEYFINRKSVRLRDIYELFLNTGIGRDGYSIIGQGRIAEIVSRKSDERRGIFEDAAGIAKFRHRKNEAERKLAATENNMERAQDVIDVIGSRLGTLERESIKAKRFLEYSEIKRKADVQLWLYDTEFLRNDIAKAENELRLTDIELDEAAEAVASLEAQEERLNTLATENKAESARIFEEIRLKTRANYELDSEIKVTETKITHAEASAVSDKDAAAALRASAKAEQDNAASKEAEAQKLADEARRLEAEERETTESAARTELAAEKLDDAIAVAFDEISASKAELSDVNARLELLGKAGDEEQDRDEAARRDVGERERIAAQHTAECADSELAIAQYDAKLAENGAILEKKQKRSAEMHQRSDSASAELSSLSVKRDTLSGKIEALRRMEEHFEGYNNSVKHVMRAYREGRINAGRIHGPLSSLIQVESRYVTAIETALGAAIQNIVVEDERTARAAIECLKRDSAGRATFFPLTSVKPIGSPSREMQEAASCKGYIGIASQLVSADSVYSSILSSMLGRIVIFDTLENATEMAKRVRYSVRTVTLDGQQINRDGSFTGGSVRTGSGILTRADEIKRMSRELADATQKSEKLTKMLETLSVELASLDEEIAFDENEIKLIETLRAVEEAKLEKARETLEADRELLEKFRADLKNVAGEQERRRAEIATLSVKARELEEKISELEAYRAERAEEHGGLLVERDSLKAKAMRITVRISELRRDIEGCNAMADMAHGKAKSLEADAAEKDARVSESRRIVKELKEKLASILAAQTESEEALSELNRRRDSSEAGGMELERKLADIRRVSRDRQARKDELMQAKLRRETALAQLRSQLDATSQKFWDEHELTRAQALEFGYEPLTAEERPAVLQIQTEYRNKIRNIGATNPAAIEEYQTERAKYDELTAQMADLVKAKNELEKVIVQLESEMKKAFVTSFDQINENFKKTFAELFGGGSAELLLTDPDNVLESGIEIKAAPPGKIIKSLMQLSGGEQAFIAIALFFAILQVNPTPFCILDEIEAALDEVNVERFAQYIRRYSDDTQFILITHRRGTMNAADRLYGVTMPESGISKILTLDVADIVNKKGGIWDELN
ncbi:MAG: chromosome segregation protein SMC [Clostridia bacterium]|nr:chromosome segregation protein SMC [Clostridia bacterium]